MTAKGRGGMLLGKMFCFLIYIPVTWVYSFCENALSSELSILCTFLCYTSKKVKNEKKKKQIRICEGNTNFSEEMFSAGSLLRTNPFHGSNPESESELSL